MVTQSKAAYNRGDILLVSYPFTDFTQKKLRPALVLSNNAFNSQNGDIVCACITSQSKSGPYTVSIRSTDSEFAQTMLKTDSVILTSKIMTVDARVIHRRLGSLKANRLQQVSGQIKKLLETK